MWGNKAVTLMNQRGNTELMASLVVALVAVVGLVMVYSSYGGSLSGAAQTADWSQFQEAGRLCGSCLQADLSGKPLPAECSQLTNEGPLYQPGESKAKSYCCRRACGQANAGERCNDVCNKAASSPARYGGNAGAY